MTSFKCTKCGSDILLSDKSHGQCPHCGCQVTLPLTNHPGDGFVDALLEQANAAIDTGDPRKARTLIDQVLELDPENAMAYLYLVFLEYKVVSTRSLSRLLHDEWTRHPYFLKAMEYAPEDLRKTLNELVDQNAYLVAFHQKERRNRILNRNVGRLMEKGSYEEALEILKTQLPKDRYTQEKIDACEAGIEREQRLRTYQKIPESYIYDTMKSSHPEVMEHYTTLRRSLHEQKDGDVPEIGRILYTLLILVTGLIFFTAVIPGFQEFYDIAIGCGGIWILAVIIGIEVSVFDDFNILRMGGMLLVLLVASGWLSRLVPAFLIVALIPVGSILFAWITVRDWIRARRKDRLEKETKQYYRNTVQPLENQIRRQIKDQYADLFASGAVSELPGVDPFIWL